MAEKQSFMGKIAEQMCRDYPKLPTMTLAKKLFAEYKDNFKNVEAARNLVRTYRGEKDRGHIKESKLTPQETPKSLNPFQLPESHLHKKEPFYLPKSSKKVLLLSDIHIPYHDIAAIEAAVEYGISEGVDTVYLNGDILDFFGVSFHEKDAKKRPRMSEEIEMGRQFLQWLKYKFPSEQIYFIPGNHEQRL